jgi:hypothetical protein
MTQGQRQLMLLHGGLSFGNTVLAYAELIVSREARSRRKRYFAVSGVLHKALRGGDDDSITVGKSQIKRGRNKSKSYPVTKLFILAFLLALVVTEYHTYTFPVLNQWLQFALHSCGLR